jgi:hypothetical protein
MTDTPALDAAESSPPIAAWPNYARSSNAASTSRSGPARST